MLASLCSSQDADVRVGGQTLDPPGGSWRALGGGPGGSRGALGGSRGALEGVKCENMDNLQRKQQAIPSHRGNAAGFVILK